MSAGEEYIKAITALDSDRRTREAFQQLVLSVAVPGTTLLDFGCGPGLDCKFYARHGFQILAYDVDPRMCATFLDYCRPEIEYGQIRLLQGGYRQFLDDAVSALRARACIVTANFAPLNMIADLKELFAAFHACTDRGAYVLASVLHPWFIGDTGYRAWLGARLQYWRRGYFPLDGASGTVYRRSFENFASQAAPYFELVRVVRGPSGPRAALRRTGRFTLLSRRYAFLVFARS